MRSCARHWTGRKPWASPSVRQIAEGTLIVTQIDPGELSPGEFSSGVRDSVEKGQVRLVVVDSLNGFLYAMPGEKDLTLHLHELIGYLNQNGVATFLVLTQHGLVGNMQVSVDVSYLTDTVVLLRYFEVRGSIRQAISVVKQRVGGPRAHPPRRTPSDPMVWSSVGLCPIPRRPHRSARTP